MATETDQAKPTQDPRLTCRLCGEKYGSNKLTCASCRGCPPLPYIKEPTLPPTKLIKVGLYIDKNGKWLSEGHDECNVEEQRGLLKEWDYFCELDETKRFVVIEAEVSLPQQLPPSPVGGAVSRHASLVDALKGQDPYDVAIAMTEVLGTPVSIVAQATPCNHPVCQGGPCKHPDVGQGGA